MFDWKYLRWSNAYQLIPHTCQDDISIILRASNEHIPKNCWINGTWTPLFRKYCYYRYCRIGFPLKNIDGGLMHNEDQRTCAAQNLGELYKTVILIKSTKIILLCNLSMQATERSFDSNTRMFSRIRKIVNYKISLKITSINNICIFCICRHESMNAYSVHIWHIKCIRTY